MNSALIQFTKRVEMPTSSLRQEHVVCSHMEQVRLYWVWTVTKGFAPIDIGSNLLLRPWL